MEDHCPTSLLRARVPWASTEKFTGRGALQVMGRAAGLLQVAWDGMSSLDEGLNLCAHRSPGCTRRTVASRPPPQGGTGRLRRTISPTSSKMSTCASPTVPDPRLKGPWWDSLSPSSCWIQLLSCYLGLGMERGPRLDAHVRISTWHSFLVHRELTDCTSSGAAITKHTDWAA